ncbi:MAG: thioesterase domain-containing protein [Rhodobacter sp.]|nr:thioesterase domain-containing protein [Rhodobacter sp.]
MDSRWFEVCTPQRDIDVKFRLFCFPYAGAGASMFQSWAGWLPPEVELVGIQLPGRETRLEEPPVRSMEEVMEGIAADIPPLLDRPYGIFGHSTGALSAFELARVLRNRGLPEAKLLMISGQNGPKAKRERVRHNLPDDEFIEVMRRVRAMPDELLQSPELLEFLLPRIRADGSVYENYKYDLQKPLDCRIALFYGLDDELVNPEGLAHWNSETTGGVHCYDGFPGGHIFLHKAEADLAKLVNHELAPLIRQPASVN